MEAEINFIWLVIKLPNQDDLPNQNDLPSQNDLPNQEDRNGIVFSEAFFLESLDYYQLVDNL